MRRPEETKDSLIRKPQLVVADTKQITFLNPLAIKPPPLKLDPVRAPEILQVVRPVVHHDRRVAARNVPVLDRQIRALTAAPDHALFLRPRDLLPVEDDVQLTRPRGRRRSWLHARPSRAR